MVSQFASSNCSYSSVEEMTSAFCSTPSSRFSLEQSQATSFRFSKMVNKGMEPREASSRTSNVLLRLGSQAHCQNAQTPWKMQSWNAFSNMRISMTCGGSWILAKNAIWTDSQSLSGYRRKRSRVLCKALRGCCTAMKRSIASDLSFLTCARRFEARERPSVHKWFTLRLYGNL